MRIEDELKDMISDLQTKLERDETDMTSLERFRLLTEIKLLHMTMEDAKKMRENGHSEAEIRAYVEASKESIEELRHQGEESEGDHAVLFYDGGSPPRPPGV